jgi:uncharacterized membrane protein
MTPLIARLILFLGVHSVRIVADDWRSAQLARLGERAWKGLYSLASIIGFVLLVWGYGLARREAAVLWSPPPWTHHVAGLLMLVSFVLLAAAYVPPNAIKARLHHPMTLAVIVWAVAHLLANGNLPDMLLFGAFLVWALFTLGAARARDRAAQTVYASGTPRGTVLAVVIGSVAWIVFAFWLHGLLIGARPFG